MRILPVIFLAAGLMLAPTAQAQLAPDAVITGQVLDDETGTPLVGVHVFIADTMIGTTTDTEGNYRLEKVPLGVQRLYVSIIGFEPEARDVLLRESRAYEFNFKLKEAVAELGEITVIDEGDRKWRRRWERFNRIFVGETANSSQTKILNPEVLDFADKGGTLLAFAGEILEIENRALGYHIQYFLKDFAAEPTRIRFDGEPLFTELEPESPEEAQMWEENRRRAFYGSFRHFILAVLSGRAADHGFETFMRPRAGSADNLSTFQQSNFMSDTRQPFDVNTLLADSDNPNEKVLDFEGAIEIIFKGELESKKYQQWEWAQAEPQGFQGKRYQRSLIWQENGATLVDYKGDLLNPYGVTVSGYLAFERIAEELPKEYRPSR